MSVKYSEQYKAIGLNIKRFRKLKGYTQEQLAEKASISISYLSKIEARNCEKSFSLEVVFDLAAALDVPVNKLIS
jgi:transcriptional regulator with XRE-family HTH domain